MTDAISRVRALVEAVQSVLLWRVGDLPDKGFIRDNDPSKTAIAAMAVALADARAALADTASQAPIEDAAGWLSIESAPKDGEEFLAYGNTESIGERWQVVFYNPGPDDGSGVRRADGSLIPAYEWCWGMSDGPTLHKDCFTHWRKLDVPPPPSTGEREPPVKEA